MPAATRKALPVVDNRLAGKCEHNRIYSQSTSASSSPKDVKLQGRCGGDKAKRPAVQRTRRTQRDSIVDVRKGLHYGLEYSNATAKGARTPAFNSRHARRAVLAKSPGGTDYIVTPGRHKISITQFICTMDLQHTRVGCPALRSFANYAETMMDHWLTAEKQLDPDVYLLSFKEGSPLEQFRQMAIQSVFNYAIEHRLNEKTIHLTCLNVSRLIHGRFVNSTSKDTSLSLDMFACMVVSSLRHAIKHDESFEKSDLFRIDPDHVWKSSSYLAEMCKDRSVANLNRMEAECLGYLEMPAFPPLAPEFLDRYLAIGAWPQYVDEYRDLASYLIGLALFATCPALKRTPNSKLAAAALVLAVKVVNTDNNNVKYEFWPERLVKYTRMGIEDLKPAIRGLASLLRNKPKWSGILEKYYGKWSEYDWN